MKPTSIIRATALVFVLAACESKPTPASTPVPYTRDTSDHARTEYLRLVHASKAGASYHESADPSLMMLGLQACDLVEKTRSVDTANGMMRVELKAKGMPDMVDLSKAVTDAAAATICAGAS